MTIYSPNVACAEEFDSVVENRSTDDWTASVTLRCAWERRHDLAKDVVGFFREWPHATEYPVRPRALNAVIRPGRDPGQTVNQSMVYGDALVTINYGMTDRTQQELFSESIEPSVEYITTDHRRFRWGSATGPPILESEAPGKPIHSLALVRTLYNLPSIPVALLVMPGTCNASPYTSALLGLTFGAETLAFMNPSMQRAVSFEGTKGWTLTLKWGFREGGWNQFWRPTINGGAGGWQSMYVSGQANPYKNLPPVSYGDFLP